MVLSPRTVTLLGVIGHLRPHIFAFDNFGKFMPVLCCLVYLMYQSYMIIIPLFYSLMQRKLLATYEIDSETVNHGVESNKLPQDDQTKSRAQPG